MLSNSNFFNNDVYINDNGEVILKRREHLNTKISYYLLIKILQNITVYIYVMTFLFFGILCLSMLFFICYTIISYIIISLVKTLNIYSVHDSELLTIIMNSEKKVQCSTIIILFMIYGIYWFYDWDSQNRGAHPRQTIRYLKIWELLADYFPIHLVVSKEFRKFSNIHNRIKHCSPLNSTINKYVVDDDYVDENAAEKSSITNNLPTDVNYLVGFHPHGILATGAFINFATEATGFSKVFPDLKPFLAILKAHFIAPFYRDFLMSLGMIAATKKGLHYVLDKDSCKQTGNFVVVVLGGASEALDSRPGTYVMHINQRYGFFKLALQTGSYLVPCISFGEQSLYRQVSNEKGSLIRWLQDKFTSIFTVSLPIFYARGPFPYRKPVYTVVGAPIRCEQIKEPTPEQVANVKQKYIENLQTLFENYKTTYDPEASNIEFI
ncbi:2-acylglycerol O-acyltransferase 2 [Schistosoma japonicum]|uniref:Acyltransferase n=1 Tax=Schistosoma japonicum TaxID=6182 RepID=A0A4Z2CMX3_SCHJA|nr:2-acylglycerol O-acyltransferase 2 [Schistosoma japonicum]TNN05623.1 2-acylglycerol O-acyltransferase 2 [Schistosoma japonicum]